MGQHGFIALVVGHHHKLRFWLACHEVARVIAQLKIQRILTLAGALHQRDVVRTIPCVERIELRRFGHHPRAVEQPHIRTRRHQGLQGICIRLHVFPIHQRMNFGLRCLCLLQLGRVLRSVFAQLLLHRLLQIDIRLVGNLQQVQENICDFIGHLGFVARIARQGV